MANVDMADAERLEWDILRQCISNTALSIPVSSTLSVHDLVLQSIVYQCSFVARTMHQVKAIASYSDLTKDKIPEYARVVYPTSSSAHSTQLCIGLLGCGTVGSALLNTLLVCGLFHKTCFMVSSRQPQNLERYRIAGVHCCFDNKYVAQNADLLYLCCLPGHVHSIASEIQGYIPKHTLVMSLCLGLLPGKLCALFRHQLVLTTHVKTHLISDHFTADDTPLTETRRQDLLLLTCPFEGSEFFQRLTFCLVFPLYQVAYPIDIALSIVLHSLLGAGFAIPEDLSSTAGAEGGTLTAPRVNDLCSPAYLMKTVYKTDVAAWSGLLKSKYIEKCTK